MTQHLKFQPSSELVEKVDQPTQPTKNGFFVVVFSNRIRKNLSHPPNWKRLIRIGHDWLCYNTNGKLLSVYYWVMLALGVEYC